MPKDYFFSNYRLADFYDDIYSFNDDISFWLKSTANSNKILELASGTGRITIPLLKNGHEVWAIDYSDEMIKILRDKSELLPMPLQNNLHIINDDMRSFCLNQKFDTIIVTANSINHIETNSDFFSFLSNLKKHLTQSGRIIFDALNPILFYLTRDENTRYNQEVLLQTKTKKYFLCEESSHYDVATQINHVRYYYTYCDQKGNTGANQPIIMDINVRMYFPQELDSYLTLSGLNIVGKYEWYDFTPFSFLHTFI